MQSEKLLHLLCLAGAAANLGKKQVDAKRSVLVIKILLELGNLLFQHVRGVANTANDAHAAGVGDSRSQLGAGGDVHASQQDGVLDLEKISDGGANLLCSEAKQAVVSECAYACEEGLGGGAVRMTFVVATYEERPS